MLWTLHCSIHNNENDGSDVASLLDLDELLASSFNPDISDNEEEVGGQENADSHRALSLRAIFFQVLTARIRSQRQSQSDSSIGSSSSSRGDSDSQHPCLQNADW